MARVDKPLTVTFGLTIDDVRVGSMEVDVRAVPTLELPAVPPYEENEGPAPLPCPITDLDSEANQGG